MVITAIAAGTTTIKVPGTTTTTPAVDGATAATAGTGGHHGHHGMWGDDDDHPGRGWGHGRHGHHGGHHGHHGRWNSDDSDQVAVQGMTEVDGSFMLDPEEFYGFPAPELENLGERKEDGFPEVFSTGPLCPQHVGPPCPRFYNNTMRDYVAGDNVTLSDDLRATMTQYLKLYVSLLTQNYLPSNNSLGPGVMVGTSGQAILFLRLYLNFGNKDYLDLARQYLEASLKYTAPTPKSQVGFLESYTGTYTIAAIIYNELGNTAESQQYVDLMKTAIVEGLQCTDDTFDTGRAGLLMAARMLNTYFGSPVIPQSDILTMAHQILDNGIKTGNGKYLVWKNQVFPDIIFWGQGHGSTGVLTQFLQMPELLANETAAYHIKMTLDYYLTIQYPDGNFPTPLDPPYPDQPDELVQWCHGAPGFMPVLTLGYLAFGKEAYLNSAARAADHVWTEGILTKGLMLCHGVSGNTYMFLFMYEKTKDPKYLYRAIKFQEFALNTPVMVDPSIMRVPDPSPYMFFDGSYSGAVVLWSDMLTGKSYHMPGFDAYP
eukprot:TRINITY_DN1791_c0_g1_i4.p1 TRINITY_DN1791_c0_g1~~TRINITY_DN1791_c0_g1_i4.p1  ORF type:complete len:543 (-),score=96.58 TRINITY_DN1791_c0_g1_i4:30-1658(-)